MKLTLQITASAATLAQILASLPADANVEATANPAPIPPIAPAPAMPPIPPVAAGDNGEESDNGPVNPNAPALDSSGLPWDERIHAATKSTNSDGTWKARRGGPKGAELTAIEAELRARVAGTMTAPAPIPAPVPVAAPMPVPPMPVPEATAPAPIPPMPIPVPEAVPTPPAPLPVPPVPVAAPAPVAQPAPVPTAPPASAVTNAADVQAAINAVTATGSAPDATAAGALDFGGFMAHLAGKMAEKDANGAPLIHADYLTGLAQQIGQAYNVQLSAITDIAPHPHMIQYAVQLLQRDGRW